MPFYRIDEIDEKSAEINPAITHRGVVGEFMKAGIVAKPDAEAGPLHVQPNEEQFTLILEGKLHYILGDEDRIVEAGDLIHIPRGVPHRSRPVGGPARFFTVKSPAGTGSLSEDHQIAEGAEEAEKLYPKESG